ncbi:MAG: PAS domain S-box protein [Chloroflexota bacterium]
MASGVSPRLGRWLNVAWDYLTAPSPKIQEPGRRRQAQLLAAFHVVIILGAVILSIFDYFVLPLRSPPWMTWGLMAACIVLMGATYTFSRTHYYKIAAMVAFGAFSLFLITSAAFHLFPIGVQVLYYLIFPLVAISFFFSIYATLLFTAANLVGMALLPLLDSQDMLAEVLYGPATFLVFATILVVFVKHQRDLLEGDRKAELTLQREQLRLITDNVRDIVAHVDSAGIIRYISPSLFTILGYLPENTIGQSGRLWESKVHPEDLESFRLSLKNLLHEGVVKGAPYRIRHAEGQYVWLEGTATPLRDTDGALTGVIMVTRDVTERHTVEQALQASEAKFRMVANTVDASIMLLNESEILYANPCAEKLTGYSASELKTISPLNIIHPDDRSIIRMRLNARLRGEQLPSHYETRTVTKTGDVRWNLLSVAIINYEGRPTTLSTAIDITDSKHAEEQRMELALERQKMRLLRRFLSDVSHDLRSPLATIGTSLYLLRKARTSEKRDYHIDVLAAQFAHLDKVVQDLLSIARLENEQDEFEFAPVDLNHLIQEIVHNHQPAAARKNHQLEFLSAPTNQPVRADAKQLRHALDNLLTNSITYTPEAGRISIKLIPEDLYMRLEVNDTGGGIAPEDLPHIFDHFYRGDKARSTQTGGAGLGLTIARRIIETHGGQINVENETRGGCTFRITLPFD